MMQSSASASEAMSREQHLLVEGHDELGLVSPIRDLIPPEADQIAARAGGCTRRGLDLGGDDLHRPDAIAHLRQYGGEDLAAFLRPFARVRHDLQNVLVRMDHVLRNGFGQAVVGSLPTLEREKSCSLNLFTPDQLWPHRTLPRAEAVGRINTRQRLESAQSCCFQASSLNTGRYSPLAASGLLSCSSSFIGCKRCTS